MNINLNINAEVVAWYGAIVATLSALISGLNFFRDRGEIKVKVTHGWLAGGSGLSEKEYIFVEGVNIGRRTITLQNVGFKLSDGSSLIKPNPENVKFPYELQEGKSITVYFELEDTKKQLAEKKLKVSSAFYIDATGKIYKTKKNLNLVSES